MRLWGKRHATALAVVFAALALVLSAVVLAQAEMFYTEHGVRRILPSRRRQNSPAGAANRGHGSVMRAKL